MNRAKIEAWALQVVDAVGAGAIVEDSRVELKTSWIDQYKAARRLAGHANAPRGESLLWLFGVDESGEVNPFELSDFADWWPGVEKHFEGPVPVPHEVAVYHERGCFVAVLFEPSQPPYVVRNEAYGKSGGGAVEREVPWREVSSVRSAGHADLLRLLAPLAERPTLEVLNATLRATGSFDPAQGSLRPLVVGQPCEWKYRIDLYVTPAGERPVVFPGHHTSLAVQQPQCLVDVKFRCYRDRIDGSH